jgi:cytochrome c-type biogenesis protein CcsB
MKILFFNDYQLPVVGCFCLFFAMILYWVSLAFPKNKTIFQISRVLVGASNLLFFITLAARWFGEGYFPLSNLYESLIFLSWGISSIHLLIEAKTGSRLIGSISTPILFFISGFSSLTLPTDMQKALPLVPSLQSNWLMMHVSMMMISYATLIVGSLLSILYLAFIFFGKKEVEYQSGVSAAIRTSGTTSGSSINSKSAGNTNVLAMSDITATNTNSLTSTSTSTNTNISTRSAVTTVTGPEMNSLNTTLMVSKLSLLETVDTWSYRIIGLGFPFLTIGIISGAVWANEAWGSYWSWDPKETWALITWLVFAVYLHSRLLKGWQGKKAAFVGSAGFFVIWICYLGVNFLGKGLHSYGWVLN